MTDDARERELEIERHIDVPREVVFRLWTKAEYLVRWFTPRRCTLQVHDFDFSVGGELRTTISEPDGSSCEAVSVFLEIVPNEKIVYRIAASKGGAPAESVVSIAFADDGEGTKLTLRQNVPEALARQSGAYPSWMEMLDRLGEQAKTHGDGEPPIELFFHPLASFCHKVLVALYENETPFDARQVDLLDAKSSEAFLSLWPVGKMPVLRDRKRDQVIPEATIILEHVERYYPGARSLFPRDPDLLLEARLWDRFFDLYVQSPMQRIVTDQLRGEGAHDPTGVADARASLEVAYEVLDRHMAGRKWVVGEEFTFADCSAMPALFFATIVAPPARERSQVVEYFERLIGRPSCTRVLREARPYFKNFPYSQDIPERFLRL